MTYPAIAGRGVVNIIDHTTGLATPAVECLVKINPQAGYMITIPADLLSLSDENEADLFIAEAIKRDQRASSRSYAF